MKLYILILIAILAFLNLSLQSAVSESAEKPNSDSIDVAFSNTTKAELLLFWDEKDLYVQTATRAEKPISQVAENMTVITAKDIEDMNAHTVAEVLNRITGIFVDLTLDFGSNSLIHIQNPIHKSATERHVLVLLDGVPWNFIGGGTAETNNIPVKIIDRIEVIKGPASSAWGSSLGGVINIITKETGSASRPTGTISASYGEGNSQDYSAEVSGKAGTVGYYLFAGKQESDGLRNRRYFDNYSLYSKIRLPVSRDINIGFTLGYSEPHMRMTLQPSNDVTDFGNFRSFFATASLDAAITKELGLTFSLYTLKQNPSIKAYVLGNGLYGDAGDLFINQIFEEKTTGVSARLVWKHDIHTAVLGVDMSRGNMDQTIKAGPFFQSIGVPETIKSHPDINKWAIYANDTIILGKLSVTPGIRYDHNNVTGSFTSPSLGLTYKLAEKTLFRASAARGFTIPPLAWTSGGGLFYNPNPSLKPETVWSFQAGIESSVTDYLWVKATVFKHDLKDSIEKVLYAAGPPTFNDLFLNNGKINRLGYELEAETAPVYNVSLKAGFASVHMDAASETDSEKEVKDIYQYRLVMKYDDRKSLMAQLFGYYTWWDLDSSMRAKYNSFIWDFNIRKNIYSAERTNTEVFLTAHNIFDGSYYTFVDTKNPRRWFEAGLRFRF